MFRVIRHALERIFTRGVSSNTMDAVKPLETAALICDPGSIRFPIDSTVPTISDAATVSALQTAARSLQEGDAVVIPTETVYGLAASALSQEATAKIYKIKGRPPDNPLIVHISSRSMLSTLLPADFVIPSVYKALMDEFWPGPLTLLFPTNKGVVPSIVTAGHDTVAVRMPSHPVARALIATSGLPLAAPSANTSGRPSPTRAQHAFEDLNGRVKFILDGGSCDVGVESTVVDGLRGDDVLRVLRPGGVTVEHVEDLLRNKNLQGVRVLVHRRDYSDEKLEGAPTTPGMKYRHYSPRCPVYLFTTTGRKKGETTGTVGRTTDSVLQEAIRELLGSQAEEETGKKIRIGLLSLTDSALTGALLGRRHVSVVGPCLTVEIEWEPYELGTRGDVAETARRLFDGLISLDDKGVEGIIVEGVEEEREGLAVMNRVRKAAEKVFYLHLD